MNLIRSGAGKGRAGTLQNWIRSTLSAGSAAGWAAIFLILSIAGISARPAAVQAQNVYRHVDQNGNVTYSTTPDPNDVPADLPKIQRENIGTRIEKIKDETPPNCSKHGGVDCSKPADSDGSVVCGDGFRDARLPYSLTCLEAKLFSKLSIDIGGQTDTVRLGAARGIARKDKVRIGEALEKGDNLTLRVSLRNMTAVAANDIGVDVRLPNRSHVTLVGPDHVEPFGAADYEYVLGRKPEGISPESLKRFKLSVQCQNCSAVSVAPD